MRLVSENGMRSAPRFRLKAVTPEGSYESQHEP